MLAVSVTVKLLIRLRLVIEDRDQSVEITLERIAPEELYSVLSQNTFSALNHHAGNRLDLVDGDGALGDHLSGDRLVIQANL